MVLVFSKPKGEVSIKKSELKSIPGTGYVGQFFLPGIFG